MLELDDSDVIASAVLVVTYTDRTERWAAAPEPLAVMVKERMDADPPPGYVSSEIVEAE